jgi:hypothetical protein
LNTVSFFKSLSVSTSIFASNLQVSELRIYPNPASNYVYFGNLPLASTVEWFNLQGQRMGSGILSAGNELYVGDLPEGLYLFRATSGTRLFTGKVAIKK